MEATVKFHTYCSSANGHAITIWEYKVSVSLSLQNGHEGKWLSSSYYGSLCFINLLLQLSVIMAGLTWAPVELMLRFANIAVGTSRNYYNNQPIFREAINLYFVKAMSKWRRPYANKEMIFAMDTRYDTPGM